LFISLSLCFFGVFLQVFKFIHLKVSQFNLHQTFYLSTFCLTSTWFAQHFFIPMSLYLGSFWLVLIYVILLLFLCVPMSIVHLCVCRWSNCIKVHHRWS
jgi:hypothetical protein